MELIYSMRRKSLKCEPPHFESTSDPEVIRPICTISTCNIIAFSSLTELSDSDGDSWSGHVYVCDLDTPWESHRVTSTVHPVSTLEWDGEGKHLLVATSEGDVSVFGQKDYLLNEWTCLYTASFPGEQIIKASFFHNGRRVVVTEKKPDAPIADRIQVLRHTPTLKGFGGTACEGALIVTGTGLVGALVPSPGEGPRALTASDAPRAPRDHVVAAALAHKAGSAVVAMAWRRGVRRGVRCGACALARAPAARAPALQLQLLPTLYLLDDDVHAPLSITWCVREETDSLLVAGKTLTLWKLTERAFPVHKLLAKGPVQGSTTPGGGQKTTTDCFNTLVWQQTAVWPVEGSAGARHVASTKLPLGAPHALLAAPRALHLLARDAHHYLCSRPVVTSGCAGAAAEAPPSSSGSPPKKPKYGPGVPNGSSCATVSHVELSTLGGVAVAVDTHSQLHVYRLPQPWAENMPVQVSAQQAAALLEYALVCGYDTLDILLALKPNIIDALHERFTESFQRQPPSFQQYYYHSWLKIRIALCSMWSGSCRAAAALCALQMASAGWAACGAALRADDKGDALDDLLPDHDKSLIALEAKAEVPGENSAFQALQALQPLRRILQRAVDTALTALAALPQPNSAHHQSHGYELWTDMRAVGVLRKLIVAARACGQGGEALSRPLARLANTPPLKNDLLEECAVLCGVHQARVWDCLPRTCVAAPHGRPWPLYFEYGVEPDYLRYNPEPPPYAQCDTTPLSAMDSIRYMYLGGGRRAARWRQCGRCGARALPAAMPSKHPLQRAYDARFLAACRCGGKWTAFSNI